MALLIDDYDHLEDVNALNTPRNSFGSLSIPPNLKFRSRRTDASGSSSSVRSGANGTSSKISSSVSSLHKGVPSACTGLVLVRRHYQ